MITAKEVKILDINSEFFGVKDEILMENAGKGAAEIIAGRFKPKEITVFCGLGNNGGDGFVAARYLSRRCKVKVVIIDDSSKIKTHIARKNFERIKRKGIETHVYDEKEIESLIEGSDVIVDALLGVGITGEPREPYKSCIMEINRWKGRKKIVSLDIPTGLGSKISIKPDLTITFHDIKEGMNKENSGEIVIVDIGIPDDAIKYVGPGELKVLYPRNKPSSHKGENGVVLVIGGGKYIGAPAISGLAALRTGIDLCYIATSKKVKEVLSEIIEKKPLLPLNLIVFGVFDEALDRKSIPEMEWIIERADTVLVGPGLGREEEIENTVLELVKICKTEGKSLVVDADAIKAVGKDVDVIKNSRAVITPHAGEFFNLTGEKLPKDLEEREIRAREWAKKLGITILLKGEEDIISDGRRVKRNKIHNPAMTVGGTGDVLAGIVSALLAKGVEPFYAACIGAFINGYAGNLAFEKFSYGMLATDIIDVIPEVLKKHL